MIVLATKNHTFQVIDPSLNILSQMTDLDFPYDVQYILMGENMDVLAIRDIFFARSGTYASW